MVERIARACYRRRWQVIAGWIGFVAAIVVLGSTAGGELHNNFDLPGSEAEDASDLLEAGGSGGQSGENGLHAAGLRRHRQPA